MTDELKYKYLFENQEHFIETSFTNDGVTVEKSIIDVPGFQGAFFKYSNGITFLVLTNMSKGEIMYITNTPLVETSPNNYVFDI